MGLVSYISDEMKRKVVRKIVRSIGDASDKKLLKTADLFKKITWNENTLKKIETIKEMIKEKHPALDLIRRLQRDICENCRNKFTENLIINGLVINEKKRIDELKNGGCTPFAVLISPTMRCNLSCVGCYAGNYSKKDDLPFELFDKVVSEGEEMGVAVFTILGGEPLVVKDDLFKICKKHNKAYFQFFTNGCLITDSVAKELSDIGNLMPIISIEGYKKETDNRRGKGVYDKVIKAMGLLKKHSVPFGYSVAVTSKNAELVSSDEFLDFMIEKGAFIGWHFLYMPIGKDPDLKLMPTPKQRKMLRDRWIKVRSSKPLFIVDFWNDAPYVGGCIAGSKYVHINSKGDCEPCIFSHFAIDSIKNKSLREIMNSGFFKELRRKQPYTDNLYMPCMWIDSVGVGRDIIRNHGCYETHVGALSIVSDKTIKGLKKYSKGVKKEFDPIWKKERHRFCEEC